MDELKKTKLPIEICITSNTFTKKIVKKVNKFKKVLNKIKNSKKIVIISLSIILVVGTIIIYGIRKKIKASK